MQIFCSILNKLIVTPISSRSWELVEDFYFIRKDGTSFCAQRGLITDFASTPRIVWPILPPYGKYLEAAVIHDSMYRKDIAISRKTADLIFKENMKELEVPLMKIFIMYWAVRMFGWLSWKKRNL